MQIKFKKLHEDAIIPEYKTDGSSGFDISSLEEVLIYPNEKLILKTGLGCELPEPLYFRNTKILFELQIRPRSGMINVKQNY